MPSSAETPSALSLSTDASTQARMALCAGLLPVWTRHLAASKAQSERAVAQMLQAFADIGPHIDLASRQSQQITQALNPDAGGITDLAQACAQALAPLRQHAALPDGGAQAIEQALALVQGAVDALQNIAKPFAHETQMVAQQVERMYIGLQYQDRISQMMGLLEEDMQRLISAVAEGAGAPPPLDEWLARLQGQYAMAEQHNNHLEQGGTEPESGNPQETTFF